MNIRGRKPQGRDERVRPKVPGEMAAIGEIKRNKTGWESLERVLLHSGAGEISRIVKLLSLSSFDKANAS